jgi:transcriptional regulator with XRE-family HTH domain
VLEVNDGATIAKRRLSRRLRELREATGLTANRVCDRLSWGRGKVGRLENNTWKRPEMSDLRDLLRFYGATDAQRREVEALARHARVRAWWREYHDVFGETEFPGYEEDAGQISCYMPLLVPGLLQTPAYIEAQMDIGAHPPAWRRRALEARRRRQTILDRADDTAPKLVAVMTEAALLYRWGTIEQRRAQLLHLIEASRRPNVELRLLRFDDGLHPGMCGPINIFDFPDNEEPAVFLETDFAIQEIVEERDVTAYIETFARIREAALSVTASRSHLQILAKSVE